MPTEAPAGVAGSSGGAARGSVVITGASAGLGASLAVAYAEPGRVLGIVARRSDALERVAALCRARGAEVVSGVLDVTEGAELEAWLRIFDAGHPLDLVIANAGLFGGIGADGLLEAEAEVAALLAVNLKAAIVTANVAATLMRARRRGRIALITSLAARHPLADAPAYSASKAGLSAYGEALREWLADSGVGVSVVLPGHIDTAQTALQKGVLPDLMSPESAARVIKRGLDRGRSTIAFPVHLLWLIRLGRCVPWRVRAWFGRSLRFTVDDPPSF